MSFKAKFVAIGGKSGIGKTTLINSLIAIYPSIFRRPISYTTTPIFQMELMLERLTTD